MKPEAQRRGIDLGCYAGTSNTELVADEGPVRRILDNLVINALAATPNGGLVMIELRSECDHPGMLTLLVRDTGPGLSEEAQQRAFQRRGLGAAAGGRGLGLSIVAGLTEELGGEYDVTSTPGAGSTFWVRLPLEHGGGTHGPTTQARDSDRR